MFVGTGKPRKPLERAEARRLRMKGMPYKRIAALLGISPSSAFNWTNDIALTPEQIQRNLYGPRGPQSPEHIARHVASWRKTCRRRRAHYQAQGRAACWEADPLHLAGCMLYWAEGSKNRNRITLANSDVHMLRFFREFLVDALGVSVVRITMSLNVYLGNGLTIHQIEQHWLTALELPRSCLRAHTINHFPTSSSGRKRNKLPYGVCSLNVGDTRLVQHIYGAIQEYAGFEEPLWLDGPRKRQSKQQRVSAEQ